MSESRRPIEYRPLPAWIKQRQTAQDILAERSTGGTGIGLTGTTETGMVISAEDKMHVDHNNVRKAWKSKVPPPTHPAFWNPSPFCNPNSTGPLYSPVPNH